MSYQVNNCYTAKSYSRNDYTKGQRTYAYTRARPSDNATCYRGYDNRAHPTVTKTNQMWRETPRENCKVATQTKLSNKIKVRYSRESLLKLMNTKSIPIHLIGKDFECIDLKSNNLRFYKQIKLPDEDRWIFGSKIVKLDHYANSYIIPMKRNVKTDDELQKLRKEIKASLNKMTAENFDSCLKEMKNVTIGNDDAIDCLIDEIFNKATLEPGYSEIYARICSSFANVKVKQTTFKIALLRKSKNMFMKPLVTQMEEVKSSWLEKIEKESDDRMKKIYRAGIEEQVSKAKDKYFGNLRFLANLYLQKTLAGKILIQCINDLLTQNINSHTIDGACMMLPVCGKLLDINFPTEMQQLITDMTKLSKSEGLEKMKKFKLMDVIDMRKRNWEMRGIQKMMNVAPKTLEKIRNED